MPPEPKEVPEFHLERARAELGAARILIAQEHPMSIAGFHLEQTVEHSLCAIVAFRTDENPDRLDLRALLNRVGALDLELPETVASAEWLAPWAVDFRYEEESSDLDVDRALEAATAAVGLAEHVLDEDNTDPAA